MDTLIIDRQAIKDNLALVKKKASGADIYAVLSGDAYGIGIEEAAKLLREEGISRFAVTEPRDAARLRDSGYVEEEILMLRSTSDKEELEALLDMNVVCTVASYDTGIALNGIAESRSTVVAAHIKVDSGMGYQGFLPTETDKIISVFTYMPNIAVSGMYTQLDAAGKGKKTVIAQLEQFNEIVQKIRAENLETGILHAAGSFELFKYDAARLDAVRVGGALFGRMPAGNKYGLQKVGHIEGQVEDVRWLPTGHSVGEGGAYRTKKPMRIATIPIGYYHGYCVEKGKDSFSLSDLFFRRKNTVKINGNKAKVLGRVGMLHIVADVTKIDCAVGDVVEAEVDLVYAKGMTRVYR